MGPSEPRTIKNFRHRVLGSGSGDQLGLQTKLSGTAALWLFGHPGVGLSLSLHENPPVGRNEALKVVPQVASSLR